METSHKKYNMFLSDQQVRELVGSAKEKSDVYHNPESYKKILGLLDLTTLNTTDTQTKIISLCKKINSFPDHFPEIPNVAAICVYPAFVEIVKKTLAADNVKIASVAGGFPSSQTFLEVKLSEVEMALDNGAEEIDIVISLGAFLEKNFAVVRNELQEVKRIVKNNHLKVILETGAISSYNDIYLASMLAMESGADFIKTSTGKQQPAATLEAVCVMCRAISDYHTLSGKKVGIKPAGGISATLDVLPYMWLISNMLGNDWMDPEFFRIGASRLANNLLSEISSFLAGMKTDISYY